MTSVRCDCCGEEGEDDLVQWCIEEALWERYRIISTPQADEMESADLTMSPGEQQQVRHTARMAELRGGG